VDKVHKANGYSFIRLIFPQTSVRTHMYGFRSCHQRVALEFDLITPPTRPTR